MAIYENYGMEISPPSDYTRHGEGDFLVQHWGKAFSFTKNGRTWYQIYNPEERYRINQSYYLNDTTANDNDKTINSEYATISLDSLIIKYASTGTSGTRSLRYQINSTEGTNSSRIVFATQAASLTKYYIFGNGQGSNVTTSTDWVNLITPLVLGRKFNSSIRFLDDSDVDDNDDMQIYARGWSYGLKVKDYEFKNCEDFAIEYQASAGLTGTSYGWFLNVLPLP